MSPEQALGEPKIDARADLYSTGVILFQLLCGRRPFRAANVQGLILAQVTERPPAPRSLNPALNERLERVILKALEKRREDRYQSADEMAEALRAAEEQEPQPRAAARPAAPPAAIEEPSDKTIIDASEPPELVDDTLVRSDLPTQSGESGAGDSKER
jgi:serine/threonine-protein kinase